MPKSVLNIAAGLLPIVATDFQEVGELVNYDPLDALRSTETGADAARFLAMFAMAAGDIIYARRQAEVDSHYANGSVDLVMSVSPYGFTLVDEWVHAKIRVGGYILVAGNASNKFVMNNRCLFASPEIAACYVEESRQGPPTPQPAPEPWVCRIANRVRRIRSYRSHACGDPTNLDFIRVFQKISAVASSTSSSSSSISSSSGDAEKKSRKW
jgi:hypothetical protein